MSTAARIIKAALAARTVREAEAVQDLIAKEVGHRYERPLGDRPSNFGLISTGGSYDHKLIENVTNMHDALLERYAARRFGDLSAVPYASPREAAEALFADVDQSELARQATVELARQARQPGRLSGSPQCFAMRDAGSNLTTWPAPSSR